MLTSNLTLYRKVTISTTVMFCLTIFSLLSKSEINRNKKEAIAGILLLADKVYEKEKIEEEEDKIIEREQIILRKQIKETCHSKKFRHITTSIDTFIIDKHRHWAYCRHAKVILLLIYKSLIN